jgi:hypothetical protein
MAILEQLQAACGAHDANALRLILQAAPLDYHPSDAGASDLLIAPLAQGNAAVTAPAVDLRLVSNSGLKSAG